MALLDNVISYWGCDDAGGIRHDAHGHNRLYPYVAGRPTEVVPWVGGKLGRGAAAFDSSRREYLTAPMNPGLSVSGHTAFSISLWCYVRRVPPRFYGLLFGQTSQDTTSNGSAYHLYAYEDGFFYFEVFGPALAYAGVEIPSFNAWHFLIGWHDPDADTVNLQVNNGTVASAACTTGIRTTTTPIVLGALPQYAATDPQYFDGVVDEVLFRKQTPTAGERSALYNQGAGLSYPFPGA